MGDGTAHAWRKPVSRVDFVGINALSSRPAGYAVALKCLQVQAQAERLDPTLKTDTHVRLHSDAWSWYQGALGEIEVGEVLRSLGPEWFVRHSVPIGTGTKDIDHLVIGPGGVFAINTKHHAGASVWVGDYVLRVNNGNTHHLKAARNDALDVSRRLSSKTGFPAPVTPVIAILNARSLTDRREPQNRAVQVVNAKQLVTWLRARPAGLSPAKIELLKLAAEEPETWHIDQNAVHTYRVMQRFERLVAGIGNTGPGTATAAIKARTPHATGPRQGTNGWHKPAPGRASQTRRPLKGNATTNNLTQTWFAAALIFGLTIYGVKHAAQCADATSPTATAGPLCALAESIEPLYAVGWWLGGVFLLVASLTTVVRILRRRR